jgi:hypothetical protein
VDLQLPTISRSPQITMPTPPKVRPWSPDVVNPSVPGSFPPTRSNPLIDDLFVTGDQQSASEGEAPFRSALPDCGEPGTRGLKCKGKGKQPAGSSARLHDPDSRKSLSSRPEGRHTPVTQDGDSFRRRDDTWYVVIKGSYPGVYFGRYGCLNLPPLLTSILRSYPGRY